MSRGNSLVDRASGLLAQATGNPAFVVATVPDLEAEALVAEDPTAMAIALRALGLAHAELMEMKQAVMAMERARLAAAHSSDANVRGEVEMTLAGVLAWAGHAKEAQLAIDRAVATLSGSSRARALVQRGAMRYREGSFHTALDDLDAAEPLLQDADDKEWLGRLFNNRALVRGFMGNVSGAEDDLRGSLQIFTDLERPAQIARLYENLGWLASRSGDLPGALEQFDRAEAQYEKLGSPPWEVWGDRCEALLGAHLVSEALALAKSAVEHLAQSDHATAHAEALLRLARAAQMASEPQLALSAARKAVRLFLEQDRPSWAVYAEYLALQSQAETGSLGRRQVARIAGAASRLGAAGFEHAALHAHLLAGKIAAAAGDVDTSTHQLELAAAAKDLGPADLRVQAWLAEALLRSAQGDHSGADRAARAGLGVVDTYQASLGASDARAAVAGHASELASLGLGLALRSHQPRRLFRWMERTRAGSLRFPPVRPPDDRGLLVDLTEFREVEAQLRDVERDDAEIAQLRRRRTRIQERIRSRSLTTRGLGSDIPSAPKAEDVLDSLRDRTLVEYGRIEDVLHAVVMHGNRVRHHELGPGTEVMNEFDALRMSVRRILTGQASEASIAAARQLIDASRARLDELLFGSLKLPDGEVIIVPPGDYHAMPWALLPTLIERPFSVVPSAALWLARADRRRHSGGIVLVGGPRLDEAKTELDRLRRIYPDAVRFTPGRAKVEPVLGALDGSGLAHVASHGTFRADNPLFSALELTDGPLTVYDLERLDRLPQTMVLSACDAGLPAERPGNEIMGLVAALLAAGTRTVVASTGLVPDTIGTLRLMTRFHRHLASGSRPAKALVTAQVSLDPLSPEGLAAASFVCFGRS